ncbi:MAG TPA: c-type cytochrome [Vicinamibacterales bacterium]|nr:c-type cytochrome [Vicinamibacterales bacterium]
MNRHVFKAITIGVFVFATSVVGVAQAPQGAAQGRGGAGAPQPPLQNLQVFPKDIARPQLLQAMQNFSAALGVTCNHCHVFNGPGDPMNDFAGDTKPTKNVARAMMQMVRAINPTVQKAVPAKQADQVAQVGCATCHRGAAIPVVAPGSPGAPPPPRGAGPGGGGPPAGAPPAGAPPAGGPAAPPPSGK